MRQLLALSTLLLASACGAPFPPVSTCDTAAGLIEAEFEVDCAAASRNAERAQAALLELGVVPPGRVPIYVWNSYSLVAGEEIGGVTYYAPGPWVELARDGRSLMHELLHVIEGDRGNEAEDHAGWVERGWHAAQLRAWHAAEPLR